MSDILAVSARLRALDDERLTSVVTQRAVKASQVKDFFDLAEAVLEPENVQRQLGRLDRPTLAVLAALADVADDGVYPSVDDISTRIAEMGQAHDRAELERRLAVIVELMLVGRDGERIVAYGNVSAQLRSWPASGLPSLAELAIGTPPGASEGSADVDPASVDRLASERAFTTTTSVSELVVELEREPARELAKGGVALPDSKRLARAASVELTTVPLLLSLADEAGLIARSAGTWGATDRGGVWVIGTIAERWGALAAAWAERLQPDLRQVLAGRERAPWGDAVREVVAWLYPAAGDWMDDGIRDRTRTAELLGITADQAPSGPGIALVTTGADAATQAMAPLLPPEVDQVYLQHDLSIVSPGPLSAGVDYRLRTLADIESRALASTWRISTSSLNRAMAAGETAESVRGFLEGISLTGIPQPLEYLLTETSARFGLLRAGELKGEGTQPGTREWGAQSYIRSEDAALIGTVLVDQTLSALALARTGEHRLVSRHPLDTVFWNLSDSRYPVAAEDSNGAIVSLTRQRHSRRATAPATDPIHELVERLRLGAEAEPDESGEAWIARQLDIAIRGRAPLTVSVRMPSGETVDILLEPLSVANGRMRARDVRSAIERTLPLSSIASVAPAPDPAG